MEENSSLEEEMETAHNIEKIFCLTLKLNQFQQE